MVGGTPGLPLRGRDGELAAIGARLDQVRSGVGSVIIVEGRAGLGKTRLLDACTSMAAERSFRVGRGAMELSRRVVELDALFDALFDGDNPLVARDALSDLHASPEQRFWLLQDIQALIEEAALRDPLLICRLSAGTVRADPVCSADLKSQVRAMPPLALMSETAVMTTADEQPRTDAQAGYADASIRRVTAENGIEYAYHDLGASEVPLILLQHFRGNLDNWDPALIDDLAAGRRVVTFDNRGVGGTTGMTPNTIEAMAHDAIAFAEAMGLSKVDLLGFSIGSFVAQEIALISPDLLRRVVLASSAPQGADGMHGWAPDVIGAVGEPEPNPQGYLDVFFAPTSTSREAGQQTAGRVFGKNANRDVPTTWQTRQAQYDAVCRWGIPNHSLLQRVSAIDLPVFVANGDSDPMILPRYSYLLTGLLPDARLKIYPDSAHGFLFQHHSRFAADVDDFLAAAG